MERDHACDVIRAHRFRQSDMRRERTRVGLPYALQCDEASALRIPAIPRLIDPHDDHAVVRQQVLLDGLAEREPVEHRTEDGLVVHRGHVEVALTSLAHQPPGVVPGGRGHKDPFTSGNLLLVKHGREDTRHHTGTAMGFVGDDEIEPVSGASECRCDHRRGLVGRKHHTRSTAFQECPDGCRIARGRVSEVQH